jgi:hypothetical protein
VVHSAQPELELNHRSGQRRESIQPSKGVVEAAASRRQASHSLISRTSPALALKSLSSAAAIRSFAPLSARTTGSKEVGFIK